MMPRAGEQPARWVDLEGRVVNMVPRNDRERMQLVLSYAGLLIIGILAWRVLRPFIEPLTWAAILTVVLHPLRLRLTMRMGPQRASLVAVVLGTAAVIVPGTFLVMSLVSQSAHAIAVVQDTLAKGLPPQLHEAWDSLHMRVPLPSRDEMIARFTTGLNATAGALASRAAAIAAGGAQVLVQLMVMLLATYSMLIHADALVARLRRALPFDAVRRDQLMRQAQDLVIASVAASFSVAVAQGILGGIAFAVVGISSPVFWGVAMGFFSLLPMVGAAIVWFPAGLWLLLTGNITQGIVLLVLGAGVISTVDNVIRPLVLRGRSPMNVVLLFVGILGGLAAFGFIGLIVGPVVLATALSLLDVYTGESEEAARAAAPPPPLSNA